MELGNLLIYCPGVRRIHHDVNSWLSPVQSVRLRTEDRFDLSEMRYETKVAWASFLLKKSSIFFFYKNVIKTTVCLLVLPGNYLVRFMSFL